MATESPPSLLGASEQVAPVTLPPRESPSVRVLIKSEAHEDNGAANSNFKGPVHLSSESTSENKLVIDEGNNGGENHHDLMKSESTTVEGREEQSASHPQTPLPQSNKLESPFGAEEPEEKAKREEGGEGEEERLEVS